MHAAHVDVATLGRLEAAVWGDTQASGAVRITVQPDSEVKPIPFDRRFIIQKNGLPKPLNKKTSQGLVYHSFGMDEKKEGRQVRRYFIEPGTRWTVSLTARPGTFEHGKQSAALDDAALLLNQAKAALALLCRYGGVGSKSRKGFGNFALPGDLSEMSREHCQAAAAQFRQACRASSRPRDPESPALEAMLVVGRHANAMDQLLVCPGPGSGRCSGVRTVQETQLRKEGPRPAPPCA